jgi:replicative DNA helicase
MVELSTMLDVSDFYDPRNRAIFEVIGQLYKDQSPIDLVTVYSVLKSSGKQEVSGGSSYLSDLVDFVPTASNVGFYAKTVRQKAVARKLIDAAREIAAEATTADDTDQLIANAMGKVEAAGERSGRADRDLLTLTEMADLYEHHVKNLSKSRFTTGFPDLDGIIRGVAPGEVMMVTAYSGLFKSAMLQNMLLEGCRRTGEYHLFFSLEMPAVRVFERTCQIGMEEYTYRVESGFNHHDGYRARALDELTKLGADRLIVCDKPAITIEQIEHYTRLARSRYGSIGAVGIDYLGLMGAEKSKSEYERISYVAENSKHLAKRLNVPVIMLTQINRSSASQGELEKWSAKGSGAVEASCDYMLGLHKNSRNELLLKVMKNRNGEENSSFKVEIDAKFLKFRKLEACDNISAKNVERGKTRIKAGMLREPVEYDPY